MITLDMVRLAGRSGYSTAVLVAGDRDLAEAVRAARDFGAQILVATPKSCHIPETVVRQMLTIRPTPGEGEIGRAWWRARV